MASLPLGASTATWRWVSISSRSDEPRHVGRVVDPLVREDGQTEPDLQLLAAGGSQQLEAEQPPSAEITSVSTESSDTKVDQAPSIGEEPERPSTGTSTPEETASLLPGNAAPATTANPPQPPTPSPDVPATATTGHPVRDKLLNRALAAKAKVATTPAPPSALEATAPGPRGLAELEGIEEAKTPRDAELDRIGTTGARTPVRAAGHQGRGELSPTMIAIFGALIGLATVASLIALVMNLDEQAKASSTPERSPQAAASQKLQPKRPVGAVAKRERKKLPGPWRIQDAKDDPTTRIVEGKVGNQAFLLAVADAGVKQKEAYRLLIAYKGLRDLDNCDRSDRFRALIERGSGRLKAFEYIVSAEEVYQARENDQGYLKAKRLDLKVARSQVKGSFIYDGEKVSSSAGRAGFEKGLRKVLAAALEGHMNLGELERGDRLRVVAQEVTVLGEFARYAGVEALEVIPKGKQEKPLRIYYFHHPRVGGYYNARGQAPYEGGWRKPIKDAPVTSKFNPKRMHPVLNKVMPHTGTDFGAAAGTPVGASSYGTVSFVGRAGPSGNLVKIQHPGGIETGYAHLSRFADGLSLGDKVKRMQVIGYVGSTGRSTGPHLHFSAKKDGKFFDAETLNLDAMRVLSLEYRGEFEKIKEKYDKLLNAIPLPPPFKEPKQAELAKPASSRDDDVDEGDDEAELGSSSRADEEEAESAAPPAPPAAPQKSPASPAKPAPKGASAVYLTDKELLEMQQASDDGEVDE